MLLLMAPLGAPKLALWAVLAAAAALVGPAGAISLEVEAELTELCELNRLSGCRNVVLARSLECMSAQQVGVEGFDSMCDALAAGANICELPRWEQSRLWVYGEAGVSGCEVAICSSGTASYPCPCSAASVRADGLGAIIGSQDWEPGSWLWETGGREDISTCDQADRLTYLCVPIKERPPTNRLW
jgi:hypothetical protein